MEWGIIVQTTHKMVTQRGGSKLAQTARDFALRRKTDSELWQERQELLEGLDRTKMLIQQAYACFNRESDPDLIESYVFEINALQRRYSYLLRRVREMEGASALSAVEG